MRNSTIALILFSLILHGCATQAQPKEDKPVATKATPEWKEVSIETEANFSAGFYAMLGREWEQASEFFEKALEGDPNSERLLRYIITCYLQLNENDKALVYMRRLAEVNTQDFSIHYTLANIHDAEGRPDEAIVEYERACRSDTELVDKALLSNAFYRLAHLYFGKEQPQKGINCLNDIINLDPPIDLSAIRTELGMAYIELGDYDTALQELETSKELNPYLPATRLYLAISYDELEQPDKAIEEAKIFMQATPDEWLGHAFLSGLYAKVENTEDSDKHRVKAISLLQIRVANGVSDTREYITLARLLIAEKKKRAALRIMELAAKNTETTEEARNAHIMLANMYYEANFTSEVEHELREALRIDPDFHEASNFLGYFFAERGEELDEALQLIETALEAQPDNGAYMDSLGWVYYKQATERMDDERLDLAIDKLIEAVNTSPDPEIYKHIGEIYYSLGRWEEAREYWEEAVAEFPEYKDNRDLKWIKMQLEILDTLEVSEGEPLQEDYTVQ